MKTVPAHIYKVVEAQNFFSSGDPKVKAWVPGFGCTRIDEKPVSINVLRREMGKTA